MNHNGTISARGIPDSAFDRWPCFRASDLVELKYGKALVATNRRTGGVPVYGSNGQCGWHDELLFRGPGVILGRKGQGPLGVEWCPSNYWVIDTAYSLVTKSTEIDLQFAYYLFKFIGLNHLKDGTSNPSLSRDTFGAQLIPIPPIDVQSSIAGLLSQIDNKIELNRKMNETLEQMARAIFKSWFIDFYPVHAKRQGKKPFGMDDAAAALFPDSFEQLELGVIPRGWELVSADQAFEINPKYSLKKGDIYAYTEMADISVGSMCVSTSRPRAFSSGSRFSIGDTLIARITPCLENGKTAYVDYLEEGQMGWGSTEFIVMRSKTPYPLEASYLLAREDTFRNHLIVNMTGSSGRQRVPESCLARYMLARPPIQIGEAFGKIVQPMFEMIKVNTIESSALALTRDLLLPRLLSGELTIKEAPT